jgi:hypothetical protein
MPRRPDPVVSFRATAEDRTNADVIARALPRGVSAFSAPNFTDTVRAALRVAALLAAEGALAAVHSQAKAVR